MLSRIYLFTSDKKAKTKSSTILTLPKIDNKLNVEREFVIASRQIVPHCNCRYKRKKHWPADGHFKEILFVVLKLFGVGINCG